MRFKVVLEPSDEGGFTVYVPSLPGCISEDDSIDEALRDQIASASFEIEDTPEGPRVQWK